MVKTLTKHGNSLALVIDKPILDLLQIDADTPLEVTTDGRSLVVTPAARPQDTQLLTQALREISDEFSPVLRNLAK